MNINQSLISKRDSTLLKGILILLIMLGHNSILMQERAIFNYLYHFHVYVFLLLPFLYNIPQFTFERVKKDFIHIYKPYTIFFVILVLINTYVLNTKFNITQVLYAYISGNEYMLKANIGASFLWFMPTMFSLLLLRNLLFHKPSKVLWTCVILSVLTFVATRVIWITTIYNYPYILFGGTVAIVYFSLAVLSRFIYEKYHNLKYFGCISCTIFILASVFNFTNLYGITYNIVTWSILPISALYTLATIVKYMKEGNILTRCFHYLGKESLPIYLFHVIIYNAILLVVEKLEIVQNAPIGVITYIITLAVTIALIYVCKKIRIYKPIFN